MSIIPYSSKWKPEWDDVVRSSPNSALIHFRDYLDYHRDRYIDASLLFFSGSQLLAVLPASQSDYLLSSHPGLTFGGWVFSDQVKARHLEKLMEEWMLFVKSMGIKKICYKSIPSFFHLKPELLAFSTQFARNVVVNDVEVKIESKNFYGFFLPARVEDRGKRWGYRKAVSKGLEVLQSKDWSVFWTDILIPNLQRRHGADPVHTLDEISALHSSFPDSIQLWMVYHANTAVGGCVLFVHRHIVHCQYISSTEDGRKLRALDFLFTTLIEHYREKSFFSLGTAISPKTGKEDPKLVAWKKSWGAKAYPTEVFTLDFKERV